MYSDGLVVFVRYYRDHICLLLLCIEHIGLVLRGNPLLPYPPCVPEQAGCTVVVLSAGNQGDLRLDLVCIARTISEYTMLLYFKEMLTVAGGSNVSIIFKNQ